MPNHHHHYFNTKTPLYNFDPLKPHFCIMLRARRNEKEMKVKLATSFKLLTIFIPQKIKQDSKQKNVSKQYLSSLCH